MKKTFIIAIIALTAAFTSGAQEVIITNPVTNSLPLPPSLSGGLQQIYDSFNSTNFGVAVGGSRSTTGQRNLAFADLLYSFTPSVGMLIGYDYLWTGQSKGIPSQANLVKGGLNLQADIRPFKNMGFATNFVITPFGFALVASGNGMVSEILGGGAKATVYSFKGFNVNVGVLYEDRTGAGYWDGKYVGGFAAISRGF